MVTPFTAAPTQRLSWQHAGWAAALILVLWLGATVLRPLWDIWQTNSTLSHSPLLALIVTGLLWVRREELRQWNAASPVGLALLLLSALLHVAAVWVDIAFLKPLSFFGMIVGAVGFLGGRLALKASAGTLGLLMFALPWPTTLVEMISFPLQLTSSAYAGLFGGMLGLPIHREGVYLHVMNAAGDKPIYSMMVAAACSGLTSLIVLLALGYLIAYHTPARWWARTVLLVSVVPMALFANAVRLTFIMMAGAHHSAQMAQWVHDHEQPFLVTLCTLGLLGLRQALLSWPLACIEEQQEQPGGDEEARDNGTRPGSSGSNAAGAAAPTVSGESAPLFIMEGGAANNGSL